MHKKIKNIITYAATMAILSGAFAAGAVDLPIDIDIIGRDGGSGEAHTAHINVEILTPDAQGVTQAIEKHSRTTREAAISGLFYTGIDGGAASMHEQTVNAASDMSLFSQPSNYTAVRMESGDGSIPALYVILVFAASIVCGFTLARTLLHRGKRKEAMEE